MRNETRVLFNQYLGRQAELNGIDDPSKKFSVTPSVEQTLEDKMRENSSFLQQINIIPKRDQSGEKVGLDMGSTIAGTKDTTAGDRETQDVHTLDSKGYNCQQVNYDTHIRYDVLDQWSRFQDFQTRIRNHVLNQIARDRIMIGFNGTSRAANSDRATYPLLQDVATGWLQKIRADKPANVLTAPNIGDQTGATYKNIDAAVYDVTQTYLAEWYQDDPNLVVIMGRKLLKDKYLSLIDGNNAPTERNALNVIMTNKQVGGLPAVRVPFFPANAFLVTRLDNLSIYVQEQSRRRSIEENAKRDRVEDYQSAKEDWCIEDYDLTGFCEGILLPDGSGGWV